LSLHGSAQKGVADLGHALIVGPPGSGKSVLLGILAAQTMKYPDAEIYYFDKGGSSRVLTMGVGGQFYDLGAEEDLLSFQPLRDIHKPEVRNWASEWVKGLLIMQGLQITPSRSDFIWEALNSLADFEEKQRSMTGLYNFLLSKDEAICDALKPYTRLGPHGKMLDSEDDRFYAGRWQTFEMEHIWNMKSVLPAILTFLFYQVQRRVDGKKPVTIFLDECWTMFKDDTFSEEINKWLKELRKFKANVVFATQSLTDIANCAIAPTVMDTCQSKIFLPNPNALEENMYKTYISFGLNRQEIEIIANATPKRHYYFKSPSGCRLFQLALGPAAMAYCAATSKEEQKTAKNIFDEYGGDLFNQKWLEHKNSPILAKKIEKVGSL
jgi:type IV secretion system protein VirB4